MAMSFLSTAMLEMSRERNNSARKTLYGKFQSTQICQWLPLCSGSYKKKIDISSKEKLTTYNDKPPHDFTYNSACLASLIMRYDCVLE